MTGVREFQCQNRVRSNQRKGTMHLSDPSNVPRSVASSSEDGWVVLPRGQIAPTELLHRPSWEQDMRTECGVSERDDDSSMSLNAVIETGYVLGTRVITDAESGSHDDAAGAS